MTDITHYSLTRNPFTHKYGVAKVKHVLAPTGLIVDCKTKHMVQGLTHEEALMTLRVANGNTIQHCKDLVTAFCDIDPEEWGDNPKRLVIY